MAKKIKTAKSQTPKTTTRPGKRVLCVILEERLHSKISLLAKAQGVTLTALVSGTLAKDLEGRIARALAKLKADVKA